MKAFYTIFVSLLSLGFCFACDFPAVFNFGDSNSDTGGLSAAFGQAGPPNGETYFHRPAGRYSDGRLMIDFLMEKLEHPHLSAFLDALGSNFSHGANFAASGSTIRPQNQSGYSPISLNVQYSEFRDFHRRSQMIRSEGGEVFKGLMPKPEYFSQALYTFDIGQNDLTAGYFFNLTTYQVRAQIRDMVDQFETILKNIYEVHGGRSFWIHNTGPLGCLPYVMDGLPVAPTQHDKFGCAVPYNDVARYFNLKLKEAVVQLRKDKPLAALTYVDIYSVKYELISNARKHGFVNPLQACCGHGGKYNYNRRFGCGSKINLKEKEISVESCKDPSVMINWDGVHYTEAANKWVFDQIVNGNFSDPPLSLTRACNKK